jgi:hypothetical protein
MSLHKNLSGDDLHDPKGVYPTPAGIPDNVGESYKIHETGTTTNYLNIDTTDGAEEVTIGNTTTNPKCTVAGTGLFTTGGGQKVAMATITGPTNPDLNASHYVSLVNTTGGVVTINLVTPSTVANQTFVFIDSHSQFGTHNLILARAASENIDNVASNKTISTNNARLTLFCDGTNWFTVIDTSSATSGIAAVVDDTTPQLGGNLDCNGNNIIIDNDNSIFDENSQEQITFLTTSSAVNQLTVTNAAAGGNATAAISTAPIITGGGTTTNCDLGLQGQGTGAVAVRANSNASPSTASQSGILKINAESNTKYVNITVPLNDDLTSYTLTLPGDDGDADQVLKTDGSGNLDWVDQASGGATKITLSPSQHTVTGTTETLIGSVYLDAGTITTVRALFGEQYAAHTASLRLRKFTGGGILHTFTSGAAPAAVSTTSLVVAGADWYDVFLFTDDAAGVAFCSGLFIEY